MIRCGLVRSKSFIVNGLVVTLPNIMRSNILKSIALDGFESYESELVAFLKGYPYPISLFVDGGANIGFYSILVQAYLPSLTRIVAVEPFSENVAYLRRIKELNGLRFELVDRALDGTGEKLKTIFYPTSSNSSKLSCNASLINQFRGTAGIFRHLDCRMEQVKTVSLSSLIEGHNDPALIKLDIEGNELPVLMSSENVLRRDNIDFIVELMINDKDKNDVFKLMVEHGYQAYLITNSGLVREDRPLTFPYPTRKDRTIWKSHFFSKRCYDEIRKLSLNVYGYWI